MNLTDAQRAKVAEWINAGAKMSEIQNRLLSELGLKLTYMEVRFLVDDLKLIPKDPEPPKVVAPPPEPAQKAGAPLDPAAAPGTGGVNLTVDHIAKPGTIVSGKVTFSDGQPADWYLDQAGQLRLAPKIAGYKLSPADAKDFQILLQNELAKLGY